MWLVLTVLFRRRLARAGFPFAAAAVVAAVLTIALPTNAMAQDGSSDAPLIGTTVTVENTRAADDSNGEAKPAGADGPVAISDDVEFLGCCGDDATYDIDVGADRITMTWVGPSSEAGVLDAGSTDEYTFTFAGAAFKRAFADHSQLLVPEVTWSEDSITVTIGEGDEVGSGRPIVILVTPFAPNPDGDTSVEADASSANPAADDNGADSAADDNGADSAADATDTGLARTGSDSSLWLAVLGTILLGAGLFLFGTSLRSKV